jgi:hypothetical protein
LAHVDARVFETAAEPPHVGPADILVLEEEFDKIGRHLLAINLEAGGAAVR